MRGTLARLSAGGLAIVLVAGLIQATPVGTTGGVPHTAGAQTLQGPYEAAVLAENPSAYYRLDETGGTTAADSSGHDVGAQYSSSGVSYSVAGALAGDTDTAVSTTGGGVLSSDGTGLPDGSSPRTVETWFTTSSTGTGTMVSEGGLGLSLGAGGLQLDVAGQSAEALSTATVANGQWHLLDLAYDGQSAFVYLDGQLAGSFQLGALDGAAGLSLGGVAGSYDELAIYPQALSGTDIDQHWSLGQSATSPCGAVPTTSYPEAVLANSPAAYYRLAAATGSGPSGAADDLGAACATGAYGPGAQAASSGATEGEGLVGTAGAQSGSPTTLLSAPSSGLPEGAASRTVEFWADLSTGKGASACARYSDLTVCATASGLTFHQADTLAPVTATLATPAVVPGAWHLVDLAYDGATLVGYVDGVRVASAPVGALAGLAGGHPLEATTSAAGMEELALYPTALSSTQVEATYAAAEAQATTTSLSVPQSATYGQAVTLSATVSEVRGAATPTGTVSFTQGGKPLGTGSLTAGASASISLASLPAGADAVTAAYRGDGAAAPSQSGPSTVEVLGQGTSQTTLAVSPALADDTSPVTLTATVTDPAGGTVIPTGTVAFDSGGTAVGTATLDATGTATFTTTTLAPGPYHFTADYSGDDQFSASTSAQIPATDEASPVVVSLTPPQSPVPPETQATAEVTVSGASDTPSGTVELVEEPADGAPAVDLASAPLVAGAASVSLPAAALPAGATLDLLALYSGSATDAPGSSGTAGLSVQAPDPSTTTLTLSNTTVAADQSLSGTVTVASPPATSGFGPSGADGGGRLRWSLDGERLDDACLPTTVPDAGSVAISGCDAAGAMLGQPGSYQLVVAYSGNDTFEPSTADTVDLEVTDPPAVSLTLASSSPTAVLGSSVTFLVAASAAAGAGPLGGTQVSFSDAGSALGHVSLNADGWAWFATSGLVSGTSTVTAAEEGYPDFSDSEATIDETVSPGPSAVSVSASPLSAPPGQPIAITATVTGLSGQPAPTGTVTFYRLPSPGGPPSLYQAANAFATVDVESDGTATYTSSDSPAGSFDLGAVYSGDTNYAGSQAPTGGSYSVGAGTEDPDLTLSAPDAAYGQPVTLTASIPYRGGEAPTGMVTFTEGTTTLGTVDFDGDGGYSVQLSVLPAAVGQQTFTASFGGDDYFEPQQATATDTVAPAPTTVTLSSSLSNAFLGQDLTVEAEVSSDPSLPAPSGEVAFNAGDQVLATVPLRSEADGFALADLDLADLELGAGTYPITASYLGNDDFATSDSGALTIGLIDPTASSSVALSSAPPIQSYASPVTFSAMVSGTQGGSVPTGTVTFLASGPGGDLSSVPEPVDAGGSATWVTTDLAAGTEEVSALYSGDATYLGSASAAAPYTVTQADTTTALTAAPSAAALGQAVSFQALTTTQAAGPCGRGDFTTFFDTTTGTALGTVPDSCNDGSEFAELSQGDLSPGAHDVTATFGGDQNLAASSGAGSVMVGAATEPSTLSLTDGGVTTLGFSTPFTLTASVGDAGSLGRNPTGFVTFDDGADPLGTVELDQGSASLPLDDLDGGVHDLSAVYGGDAVFEAAGTGPLTVTVVPAVTNPSDQRDFLGTAIAPLGIEANDPDFAQSFSATGLPAGLSIDPLTGIITGAPTTDGITNVVVTVTDTSGYDGQVSFTWTVTNQVTVTSPGTKATTTGNSTSVQLKATDSSSVATITGWSATGLPAGLSISATSGLITGIATTGGHSSVTATATDSAGFTGSVTFTWVENNSVTVVNPGSQALTVNQPFSLQMSASDSSSVATIVSWQASGLPDGLSIDPVTGLITGTPTTASSQYASVSANDNINYSNSADFLMTTSNSVTVDDPGPQISPPSQPITPLQIIANDSASGATLTYTDSETLPPGLSIDPVTGLITGTPTTVGLFSVTITATDGSGASGKTTLAWTIGDTVSVTNPGPQYATTGSAISALQVEDAVTDPDATVSFSASGLPSGLSIASATGLITGTPTSGEDFSVSLTVTDNLGYSGHAGFTWDVTSIITVANPVSQSSVSGTPTPALTSSATDSSSVATVSSWSVSGLPPGLSADPTTGTITGTPTTAGDYPVTLTATDSQGFSGQANFTWTVTNQVMVTSPGTKATVTGSSTSVQLKATDSSSVATITGWSATGLPAGLSVNPTSGLVTGIATTAGHSSVTATATDSAGFTGSVTFNWIEANSVIVASPGSPTLGFGQPYSLQMSATDSSSVATIVSWLASGLPNGLSIDSTTGLITGTPTTASAQYATVSATDTVGATGSIIFFMTVYQVYLSAVTLAAGPTNTYGDPAVSYIATVTGTDPGGDLPSGQVELSVDGTMVDTKSICQSTTDPGCQAGTAVFSSDDVAVGDHQLTAVYEGDDPFTGSTSQTVPVTVTQATSATTVAVEPSGNENQSAFNDQDQSASFSAQVTTAAGSAPLLSGSDTVTFSVDETQVGEPATVVWTSGGSGSASITLSSSVLAGLGLTSHSVTAGFDGDPNIAPSTSTGQTTFWVDEGFTTTISLSFGAASPGTDPSCPANPDPVFGQLVALSAVLSPESGSLAPPSGTVSFFGAGGAFVGADTVADNSAVICTSALPGGSDAVTASYGGDQDFEPAQTSASLSVGPALSSLTITSSAPAAASGETPIFSGKVSPAGAVASKVSVTLVATDGEGNQIDLGCTTQFESTGQWSLTPPALPLGTYTVTATYSGDGNYVGSSGSLTQAVLETDADLLAVDPADPAAPSDSSIYSQSVTFDATVTNTSGDGGLADPSGTVDLLDGVDQVGSSSLVDGSASFTVSQLSVASHTLSLSYGGDSIFAPSQSVDLGFDVAPAPTTTSLAVTDSGGNPITTTTYGASVVLSAMVLAPAPAAGTPTGSVTFSADGQTLGEAHLFGTLAILTVSAALAVGLDLLSASYVPGSSGFSASDADRQSVSIEVDKGAALAVVSTSTSAAMEGSDLTFTATVQAMTGSGVPTGSVAFWDGTSELASANVGLTAEPAAAPAWGQATLVTSSLGIGTHDITIQYSGDDNFTETTSAATVVVVRVGLLSTTVVELGGTDGPDQPGTSQYPDGFNVEAQVQGPGPVPEGMVTFFADQVSIGTGVLGSNGPGDTTLSGVVLPAGVHTVTAAYASDDDTYSPSQSPPVTETVTGTEQLAFVSPPVTTSATTLSSEVTIELQSITGVGGPSALGAPEGGLDLTLGSSSPSATFFSVPGGPVVTSVALAPGQSAVSVYYTDTVAGKATIYAEVGGDAAGQGINYALQSATVTPGALDHLEVSPAAMTEDPGVPTPALQVAGYDAEGNLIGDVTTASSFSLGPSGAGSCENDNENDNETCTATAEGNDTITATDGVAQGQASLTAEYQPVPTLSVSSADGQAPDPVTFTLSSTDPDGYALTYSLNVGNGSAPLTGALPVGAATVPYVYEAACPDCEAVLTVITSDQAASPSPHTLPVTVDVAPQAPLAAAAGGSQRVAPGQSVEFDGVNSSPGPAAIGSYHWDFGDPSDPGQNVADTMAAAHIYQSAGYYTATLTVTENGSTSSDTAVVTVGQPDQQLTTATVTDAAGGAPVDGASVVIVPSSGGQEPAAEVPGEDGTYTWSGLADGNYAVYVTATGYLPTTGTVEVSGGTGDIALALQAGQLTVATLSDTELTAGQAAAAGVDETGGQGQQAYQYTASLAFGGDAPIQVSGIATPSGIYDPQQDQVVGGGDEDDGGGPGCCNNWAGNSEPQQVVNGQGYTAIGTPVDQGQSMIWMVLPGQAEFLDQYWAVQLQVENLVPSGFTLTGAAATLTLGAGLELAAMDSSAQVADQTLTQNLGTIGPGDVSSPFTWYVAGTAEGIASISADFTATLDPVGEPIDATASAGTVEVWGLDALKLGLSADSQSTQYAPYHVGIQLTDIANVPLDNVTVALDNAPPDPNRTYQNQPDQQPVTFAQIEPQQTVTTPMDDGPGGASSNGFIVVPDFSGGLDTQLSGLVSVEAAGQSPSSAPAITTISAPVAPQITSDTLTGQGIEFSWPAQPGATGYSLAVTPDWAANFDSVDWSVQPSCSGGVESSGTCSGTVALNGATTTNSFFAISTVRSDDLGSYSELDLAVESASKLGSIVGGALSDYELAGGAFCLTCYIEHHSGAGGAVSQTGVPSDIPANANAAGSDPVNTADGDFYEPATDLGEGAIALSRTYDTDIATFESAAGNSPESFGYGWSTWMGMHLALDAGSGVATVTEAAGNQVTFVPTAAEEAQQAATQEPNWCDPDDSYCPSAPRTMATLNEVDGDWDFTDVGGDGTQYVFGPSGALVTMAEADGTVVSSSPGTPGAGPCPTTGAGTTCTVWSQGNTGSQLASGFQAVGPCPANPAVACVLDATDSAGTELGLALDAAGQVVAAGTGASGGASPTDLATYCYYGQACAPSTGGQPGDLASVTNGAQPGGTVVISAYTYDASHELLSATTPVSGTVTNVYNASGQVTQQDEPGGAVDDFCYAGDNMSTDGGTTTVTDYPDGVPAGAVAPAEPNCGSPPVSGSVNTTVYSYAEGVLSGTEVDPGTAQQASETINRNDETLVPTSIIEPNGSVVDNNLEVPTASGGAPVDGITSSTDSSGNQTLYAYTPDDQVWCEVSADEAAAGVTCPATEPSVPPSAGQGRSSQFAGATITYYNAADEPVATTDPRGNTSAESYTSSADGVPAGLVFCSVDAAEYEAGVICPDQYGAGWVPGTTATAFSADGQVLNTTDPGGATTSNDYANAADPDQLSSSTGPHGTLTTYSYNADDQVTTKTEAFGSYSAQTQDGYDALGREDCTVGPDAYVAGTRCPSDPATPGSGTADAYLGATITTYDPLGRVVQVTSPTGGVTLTGYAPDGSVDCTVGPDAVAAGVSCPPDPQTPDPGAADPYLGATITTYNGLGQVAQVASPIGGITSDSYTADGQTSSQTVTSGNASAPPVVTSYGYDADDDLTSTTVGTGSTQEVSTSAYDDEGNAYCTISAKEHGSATCPSWQPGWVDSPLSPSSVPAGVSMTFADADGDTVEAVGPTGGTTINAYDADDRSYCSLSPANDTTWATAHPGATFACPSAGDPPTGTDLGYSFDTFDPDGNVVSAVDPDGNTTTTAYDAAGDKTSVEDGGATTTYCYYASAGSCASSAPGNGGAGFDLYSVTRPPSQGDPSGAVTSYTYAPGGQQSSVTTPSGSTTSAYDAAGQLTSTLNSPVPGYQQLSEVTYTYLPSGERQAMTDDTGTTTYSYDAAGDQRSQSFVSVDPSQLASSVVNQSYYPDGALAAIVYPATPANADPTVTYTYDDTGAMATMTDMNGQVTTYHHDQDGNLTGTAFPNGTASTATYNAADQVTAIAAATTATPASTLASFQSPRNPAGQVAAETDTLGGATTTASYDYDPDGYLLSSGAATSASYDSVGDPTRLPDGTTASFDQAGEMTSSTTKGAEAASSTYSYDTLGDRTKTQATTAGGDTSTTDYRYDQAGQLDTVTGTAPAQSTGFAQLDADQYGYDTYGVKADGTLWAWGDNTDGQLGNGTTTASSTPVQVEKLRDVISVSSNEYQAAAVDADGSVWVWGENTGDVLGASTPASAEIPQQVPGVSGAVQVAMGSGSVVVRTADGTVFTWGSDHFGQLGQGTVSDTPEAVPEQVSGLSGVASIAAGAYFALAVTTSGATYTWGDGADGALGNASTADEDSPTQVGGLPPASSVSAAYIDAGIVGRDGTVWLWGDNDQGQLGPETSASTTAVPLQLPGLQASALSVGYDSTLATATTGTLMGWGDNSAGQLGLPSATATSPTPVQVSGIADPVAISAGKDVSEWVSPTGQVQGLGSEAYGTLGDDTGGTGTTTDSAVSALGWDTTPGHIAAGTGFTLAAKSDGTAWAWGANAAGQLGDGTTASSDVPVEVEGLGSVVSVAAGNGVSLAVLADGTVSAWGDNSWGVLGTGSDSPASADIPTTVAGLSSIVEVAIGSDFAMALDDTGRVWLWGKETNGALANDTGITSTAISAPLGPTLSDVTAIAAGGTHALAVENDNHGGQTLYAWGDNSSGELGLGTTTDASRPNAVPGITSASAIAASASDSYVLGASGTLSAMGDDSAGQLPGSTGTQTSPVALSLPEDAGTPVGLAASGTDAYVEADQDAQLSVLGFGSDASGQLGTPTSAESGTTTLGTDAAPLSAGPEHLVILAGDANVATVGDGTLGELGNATTASTTTLVPASGFAAFVPDATPTGAATTAFAYNGDGLRVMSANADNFTTSVYLGTGDDPELLTDGTYDFLYGPGGQVCEQVTTATATPTYLVQDQLGSTRLLTDASGEVVGTASYDAEGNETEHSGTATSPIGYAGGYTDATGLIYLIHRYYDPASGEFLSVDPLVDHTMEPYLYANDDAILYRDPDGLNWESAPEYDGCTRSNNRACQANWNYAARDIKSFLSQQFPGTGIGNDFAAGIHGGVDGIIPGGLLGCLGGIIGGPPGCLGAGVVGAVSGFVGGFLGGFLGSWCANANLTTTPEYVETTVQGVLDRIYYDVYSDISGDVQDCEGDGSVAGCVEWTNLQYTYIAMKAFESIDEQTSLAQVENAIQTLYNDWTGAKSVTDPMTKALGG